MSPTGFLVEGTNVDALITIDVVHTFFCSRPVLVPEPEAFFPIKRPFQESGICGEGSGLGSPGTIEDRLRGAVFGAFFTHLAEFRHSKIDRAGGLQRKVGKDLAESHPGTKLRSDENPETP